MNLGAISAQFGADVSGFMNGVAQVLQGSQQAVSAMQAMSNASAQLNNASIHINGLSSSVQNATTRVGGLHGVWNHFTSLLANTAGGIVGVGQAIVGGISSFVSFSANLYLAVKGYFSLITGGTQFVQSLVVQNAAMEQTRIVFTGLLHSGQAAGKMLGDIQTFAGRSPFEFPQLVEVSRKLLTMGVSAQHVLPYLQAIGDTASGTGKGAVGIDMISKSLGIMAASQEITVKGMTLLIRTGVPGWQLLANAMGLSVVQVQNLAKHHKLGADALNLLIAGMEKMYGGSMAAQAKTFNGLAVILNDTIANLWKTFTGPLFEHAKQALFQITQLIGSPVVKQFASDMGILLGNAIGDVANFLTTQFIPGLLHFYDLWQKVDAALHGGGLKSLQTSLHTIGEVIGTYVNPLLSRMQTWFASLFTDEALLADARAISTLLGDIGAALAFVGTIIGPIVTFFVGLAQAFGDGGIKGQLLRDAVVALAIAFEAVKITQFLIELPFLIGTLWGVAAAAWGTAFGLIAMNLPLVLITAAIALAVFGIILAIQHWGDIVKWLQGVWGNVSTFFVREWNDIKRQFSESVAKIEHDWHWLWTTVANFFVAIWKNITETLAQSWAKVQHDIQWLWDTVTGATRNAWGAITGILAEAATSIVMYLHDRWNELVMNVQGIWNSGIVLYLRGVGQTILNILVKLGTDSVLALVGAWVLVRDRTQELWNTVYEAIASVVGRVVDAVVTFGNGVATTLADRWRDIQDAAASAWRVFFDNVVTPLTDTYTSVMRLVNNIKNFIVDRWHDITSATSSTYASLDATVTAKLGDAGNTVKRGTQSIGDQFAQSWARVRHDTEWAWTGIASTVSTQFNKVLGFITDTAPKIRDWFLKGFGWARDGVGGIIKGLGNNAIDMLDSFLGGLQTFLNAFGDALNNVAKAVGASGVVPHVDIARVPHFASGVEGFGGGMALVGERGPELVTLPRGAGVLPATLTQDMLGTARIPGFAGGVGNPLGDVWTLLSGGVSGIIDKVMHTLGGLTAPGGIGGIATGVLSKITGMATTYISHIIGTLTSGLFAGTLPQFQRGQFLTPGVNTEYGAQMWYGRHQGVDFSFPQGTGVEEVAGGKVTGAGFHAWGGELDVAVGHGLIERYLHLSQIFKRVDDIIARGDLVGLSGGGTEASGLGYWSNGAHLHYQFDAGNINAGVNTWGALALLGINTPWPNMVRNYAEGGVISEPVAGRGLNTGARYMFGENGPEYVSPHGASGGVTVVLQVDGRTLASALAPHMAQEIRIRTGIRK